MLSQYQTFKTTGILILAAVSVLPVASAIGQDDSADLRVDYSVIPRAVAENAKLLREQVLLDNLPVDIIESVTTEVGPRRIGTDGDKRAIAWAQEKFKELGFDRVWTEEVELDRGWTRGEAKAEILAPYPHNIVMTALGYSVGTEGDLVAEIVEFPTFTDLEAVPEGDSLKGKIAFVSYSMIDFEAPSGLHDLSAYSEGTKARYAGPVSAAKRGAEAIIIRSVGTDNNRYAHTGSGYRYVDDVKKIPAAAVSAPDAILIQNMLQRGIPVTLKMNLTSEITGPAMSANVIGEITGRDDPNHFVLLGAHLDSWDEGTGALDDGAGIGSMMAAAAHIGQMQVRPRRSIRVVLFAGEEIGYYGGIAYTEKQENNIDQHLLGAEVDEGGGRANTLTSHVGESSLPIMREMHKLIAPLGVAWNNANNAEGQSDIWGLGNFGGMPVLNFTQNENDYFMYHHTPNDTFDKIIPEDIRYLTAAYATMFYLAAEMDVDFRQ